MPKDVSVFKKLIKENWGAGLTVALISVPLSIALSIASGAGPVPGLITGIWATLIASIFGGSNYNIIGAAGALTTVLFAATLAAPLGLGASVLPILAILTGIIIFLVWILKAERFLYYIPSSVMYGFSAGVAFLIAASQLFDASGLSDLKRTGHFVGDLELFIANSNTIDSPTLIIFLAFLAGILTWKRFIKKLPAVIPASVIGIIFGFFEAKYLNWDLISLGDKFGQFTASLIAPVPWHTFGLIISDISTLVALGKIASIIALIAILETLITAKIGDALTKTQSSASKELLGLSLANIGSGIFGGLPATGVFIRTGANIKAGATHRISASIAAITTAIIALVALPYFTFIPMAVIAALLVNTAIGLIETQIFKNFWKHEKASFWIAIVVALVTVFEDAGTGVVVGAILALLKFADTISHGRFDAIINYQDGTREDIRGKVNLHIPQGKEIEIFTYSIAGFLGYIDSTKHAANLRQIAQNQQITYVIIRLRDLFTMDFEGEAMLAEALQNLHIAGKKVYISSANENIINQIADVPFLKEGGKSLIFKKTMDAIVAIRKV